MTYQCTRTRSPHPPPWILRYHVTWCCDSVCGNNYLFTVNSILVTGTAPDVTPMRGMLAAVRLPLTVCP